MQKDSLLISSQVQGYEISQLSFKLKKQKKITYVLVLLVLSLITILTLNFFSNTHQGIVKTTEIKNESEQTCTDLQLNKTNLTQFSWKMEFDNSSAQQSYLLKNYSKITSLDLSNNLLNDFSNNSLPTLQKLNILGNNLKKFSNNKLPRLLDFRIRQVVQFSNNYLPLIQNFYQESFFFVDYFNNNYIPTLNDSRNFFKTKTVINNTIGINGLRFDIPDEGFQFYNNTMIELKSLTIFCWNYLDLISPSKIMNNYFPKLQEFVSDCNIDVFQQSKKLNQLKILYLKSPSIKSFSDNFYPNLKQLYLKTQNLKSFTNNSFPLLQTIQITSSQLSDICTGLQMPNIKKVTLQIGSLKNIDCLRNSPNLQVLVLYFGNFKLRNFNLVKLTQLYMMLSSEIEFINSSFPAIERVIISGLMNISSLNQSNIIFGESLKMFSIQQSSLKDISFSKQMPNLTDLYVRFSKLTSFNCFTFRNVNILQFSGNQLKDDAIDKLIQCNFTSVSGLYLEDNLFSDKKKAKAKLSSRYPNAYISL